MERLEALKNYYETHNEDIRLESRHGMVEFLTTIDTWVQEEALYRIFGKEYF